MAERITEQSNENLKTPEVSAEQYERLAEQLESNAEKSKMENAEKKAETALVEAREKAAEAKKETVERKRSTSPTPRRGISKKERDASFDHRMKNVRAELSAPERAFSKFIHAKPVEKISDVVGSTIARPNAILSGAVVAFVAVLAVYLVAKNFGYPLSGFETIAAFIAGWIAGLLYDFLKVMITGKK